MTKIGNLKMTCKVCKFWGPMRFVKKNDDMLGIYCDKCGEFQRYWTPRQWPSSDPKLKTPGG